MAEIVSPPVFLKNGQQLKVNDHVYCSPAWAVRDGTPYSIARIIEFLPPEGVPTPDPSTHSMSTDTKPLQYLYTRVRLAWYYRPSDVSDRPVSDSRLLLAAIYSEVCDINQLRAKCHVVHRDKISDLSGWKKRPDCFYFNRLFDPYIKKEFEIILASDVRNLPEHIRTNLCSRYEYVVTEKDVVPDLTDSLRLCSTCSDWCPNPETVQCDRCKSFFHMSCVQPPLLAKPSRGYGWTCAPCSRQHEEEVDSRDTRTRLSTPQPRNNKTNAPAQRSRGRPRKDKVQAEKEEREEVKHFRGWPFRYFGQYTVAEDTLDEEDLIFPRCGVRFGPKYQATVPLSPDLDKSKPIENDQRGGENTVQIMGWLHKLTPEEEATVDQQMRRISGTQEDKANVGFLVEAVRLISEALLTKQPLDRISVSSRGRRERWNTHTTPIMDPAWRPAEIAAFEDAIQMHGPELRAVREEVGTRNIHEIVRFYGHWKNSKLKEENARIRSAGKPSDPPPKHYETLQQAQEGQQVGSEDEGSVISSSESSTSSNMLWCGACRTRETPRWWKAPKGLVTEVLCETCGTNWRKYADLNVRPVREESVPVTGISGVAGKRVPEKRDATPLSGGPPAKRVKTTVSGSKAYTPPPAGPLLRCLACSQDGPVGKVLKCKKCKFTIHAGTCGAVVKPADVESWLCDICQNEEALEASLNYRCLLCPPNREDLKPTPDSIFRACKPTEGQGWVHVLCAVFMPDLTFTDASRLRLVEGISTLPTWRWTKKCRLCQSTDGAVIRCNECNREYHASCGWKDGHRLGFEIQPVKSTRRDQTTMVTFNGETGCMSPVLYCSAHDAKKHDIYNICETNEGGETAMQVFVQSYRQAAVGQAHGLLRKARRLDQVLSRPTNGAATTNGGTRHNSDDMQVDEPHCLRCHTTCTPFWHKRENGVVCHRCSDSAVGDRPAVGLQA